MDRSARFDSSDPFKFKVGEKVQIVRHKRGAVVVHRDYFSAADSVFYRVQLLNRRILLVTQDDIEPVQD